MKRSDWRKLMRAHAIRPDRRLGQNFLVEPWALQQVVASASLEPGEHVLEIGAGLGALTRCLAESAARVVAVEFDSRLIAALRQSTSGCDNVNIVMADALQLNLGAAMSSHSYSVVANIPYNITSALIRKLMEADHRPTRVVLTIQKEVAQRITAGPGAMSLLALSVQIYGNPTIAATLPPGVFLPAPEVDSAVLRIELDRTPRFSPVQVELIFKVARAGFGQRRKQLRNALSAGLDIPKGSVEGWLDSAGIEPRARAQELTIDQWHTLAGRWAETHG